MTFFQGYYHYKNSWLSSKFFQYRISRINLQVWFINYWIRNKQDLISIHHQQQQLDRKFWKCSGDHDMLVPHISSSKWISSLNLTLTEPWRPWFLDDQVAGLVQNSISYVSYFCIKCSCLNTCILTRGYTPTYNYEDTYELVFATIKVCVWLLKKHRNLE